MKYYCIKQHNITDCGAACLATISKQNGYKIGIRKIREVAGTDKQGTKAYGVIKAEEQLGFRAKGVKGLFRRFFHLLLPQKKLLLHIFVAFLVYTIQGILGAFYYQAFVDDILPDGLLRTLTTLSIGVIHVRRKL